jgi:hypothetical protein
MYTTKRCGLYALLALAGLVLVPTHGSARISPVHGKVRATREAKFKQLMSGRASAELKRQVYNGAKRVVQKIVRNPRSSLTSADKAALGLASPQQRAKLLKEEGGFKVESRNWMVAGRQRRAKRLVITLPRDNQSKLDIFNKVMSPNNVLFMPAGGHSKYVWNGGVADLWGMYDGSSQLRANSYPLFTTWMSDAEARRMYTLFDESKRGGWNAFTEVLGPQKMAHGRPGMWPVTPNTRRKQRTGNSCTTGFIRAPVGERKSSYGWIDQLQQKVAQANGRIRGIDLANKTLLEAVSGKSTAERTRIFDKVKHALPRERAKLDRLKGEVDLVAAVTPRFPMELLHRERLADMANIVGDPVGPGGAKQKFKSADPIRIGVMAQFEKAPRYNGYSWNRW